MAKTELVEAAKAYVAKHGPSYGDAIFDTIADFAEQVAADAVKWIPTSERLPGDGYVWFTECLGNGELSAELYFVNEGLWYCEESDYREDPAGGRVISEKTFPAWCAIQKPEPYIDAVKDERECPCLIADEPCQRNCTCVHQHMSHGCFACARYGSEQQRKEAANHIVNVLRDNRHSAYRMPEPYIDAVKDERERIAAGFAAIKSKWAKNHSAERQDLSREYEAYIDSLAESPIDAEPDVCECGCPKTDHGEVNHNTGLGCPVCLECGICTMYRPRTAGVAPQAEGKEAE